MRKRAGVGATARDTSHPAAEQPSRCGHLRRRARATAGLPAAAAVRACRGAPGRPGHRTIGSGTRQRAARLALRDAAEPAGLGPNGGGRRGAARTAARIPDGRGPRAHRLGRAAPRARGARPPAPRLRPVCAARAARGPQQQRGGRVRGRADARRRCDAVLLPGARGARPRPVRRRGPRREHPQPAALASESELAALQPRPALAAAGGCVFQRM